MVNNPYYIKTEINKPVEQSLSGFNKPVEIVYELKNEKDFVKSPSRVSKNSVYDVPAYEELLKSYKVDEKVNYDDLESGSVGEVGGYGPCIINGQLKYENC